MRVNRIFVDQVIETGVTCDLPAAAAHHVATVLRMKPGQMLSLFNGRGGQYEAEIVRVDRRKVAVLPGVHQQVEQESPLSIHLLQGISRGQKMDLTLQKAVELGVASVQPVICEQGNVKLDEAGRRKRENHWRNIIISACEQSGRNTLPALHPVESFPDAVANRAASDLSLLLHPGSETTLSHLDAAPGTICLLTGPEGGFSEREMAIAAEQGFSAVKLGPRVLRTETTALAAVTACQVLWGDLCA